MAGQSLPACLRVLTLKSAPTVGPGPSASGVATGPAASERKAWTNVDLPAPENRSENPPVCPKKHGMETDKLDGIPCGVYIL